MSSVHNSVETVNAAATAIVTAESRVQPSAVQVCVCISTHTNLVTQYVFFSVFSAQA